MDVQQRKIHRLPHREDSFQIVNGSEQIKHRFIPTVPANRYKKTVQTLEQSSFNKDGNTPPVFQGEKISLDCEL